MQIITITISGMSCGHCLNAVNQALAAVPGVTVKSVQIGRAELLVSGALNAAGPAQAAIEAAGYKVEAVLG
jgi:copper chaperone CopZ